MPTEEGIGLHNEERLFPTAGRPCEQYQEHAIGLGTRWALHPTAEDNQLLTKQGVFGQEFSPGTGQIGKRSSEARVMRWSRPLQGAVAELKETTLDLALEQGKQYRHSDQAPW
jgi:hypothetical protein